MPTYPTARDALQVLASLLRTELSTTHAATFAGYGGAQVVFADDEPGASERVGVPCVVLNVQADRQSEAVRLFNARDAIISATVEANDFSGARVGAANPEGSDTKLSRVLSQIIFEQYETLRDAGLMMARFDAEAERVEQSDDAADTHQNPHRIYFTYFVP